LKTKNPYTFFDTYCLRTPTFSVSDYMAIIEKEELPPHLFSSLWENKTFKEAVYLASPHLYSELEKMIATGNHPKTDHLQLTMLKYYARISSRCTPFGLFAGCSLGAFSDTTTITLLDHRKHTRTTRFDMHFLVAFIQMLLKEKTIKEELSWFPNTSLYLVGNQYRYIEYSYEDSVRQQSIEAVTKSNYLVTVLERAQKGATIPALIKSIISSEISENEAMTFIHLLIENQLLVSDIEPNITGEDYFKNIEKIIATLPKCQNYTALFKTWRKTLLGLDSSLENNILPYTTLFKSAKETYSDADAKYLLQVDTFVKTKENTLHKKHAYSLLRALPFLNRINSLKNTDTAMAGFKQAFVRRYETKEVPLTIALDTEVGIGFNQNIQANDDTTFLNTFTIKPKREARNKINWSKWDSILFKKLEDLTTTNAAVLHLTDNDVLNFPEIWNDLPDTISAMVEVVTINTTEMLFIETFGGASAINLLGRFTTGDAAMKTHVTAIAKVEQQINNDKIVADILHLPEARLGNILQRASLSKFEIPYLANSLADKNRQIDIKDIMISVKSNRIILRSKKHNKEIVPRLYNAHNYRKENALPIYQFLCELQTETKRSSLVFFWSAIFSSHRFLPRVVYKNIILSKARWRVLSETFKDIIKSDDITTMKKWMATHKVPKWVTLVEGDNTLLLNLLNKECLELLGQHCKTHKTFILEEFLFTEDQIVKQNEKGFTNQCIISFYNEEKLINATKNN
jgi:hypothetical protein